MAYNFNFYITWTSNYNFVACTFSTLYFKQVDCSYTKLLSASSAIHCGSCSSLWRDALSAYAACSFDMPFMAFGCMGKSMLLEAGERWIRVFLSSYQLKTETNAKKLCLFSMTGKKE